MLDDVSRVTALCAYTAVAAPTTWTRMASTDLRIFVRASTTLFDTLRTASISVAICSVALAACDARFITSLATTAKPRPASVLQACYSRCR